MMLYKIQPALVNKIVGYIVSRKMTEGYQYDDPNSVWNINVRGKMGFVPNIDAIQLLKRAKLMDIVQSVPVPPWGLVISDKLLEIFKVNVLPIELQVFDAYVVHKEKRYHYNYFYIYQSNEHKYIDWGKSKFKLRKLNQLIGDEFKVDIKKERAKLEKGIGIDSYMPTKLFIKKNEIRSDILKLDLSCRGYYVTEKLKNEIEKGDCQGVDLIPIDQLGFEVEFV
ncbi:hypothetical protein [Robiginitalea sp.]|uniref:hypothetical protein n=1 Tax=Robiginitalea sp. TaxID=1902411 RepID=UPI003C3FA8F9